MKPLCHIASNAFLMSKNTIPVLRLMHLLFCIKFIIRLTWWTVECHFPKPNCSLFIKFFSSVKSITCCSIIFSMVVPNYTLTFSDMGTKIKSTFIAINNLMQHRFSILYLKLNRTAVFWILHLRVIQFRWHPFSKLWILSIAFKCSEIVCCATFNTTSF